jgi:hypothetical protein
MKQVEFIQTCVNGRTPLLRHYEEAKTRTAGVKTKRAIIKAGYFTKFDLFTDYAVQVELMRYQKESYAIVTHSAINHIFKLYN